MIYEYKKSIKGDEKLTFTTLLDFKYVCSLECV